MFLVCFHAAVRIWDAIVVIYFFVFKLFSLGLAIGSLTKDKKTKEIDRWILINTIPSNGFESINRAAGFAG